MATILGSITSSHVPAIGGAIAKGLQQDPYFKPFFDGFPPAHAWLAKAKHDVAVIFYNDHGLNFFLDKMPTFAVGAAPEYRNADEGWGIPTVRPFKGDPELSWHLIDSLVAAEFDITTCQEMLVDHALTLPLALLWPDGGEWPVRIVPIAMNHVQHPLPTLRRSYHLGQAVGRALDAWDSDARVVVMGRAVFHTNSMASAPASSTRRSTSCAWTHLSTIRSGSPASPSTTSCAKPVRRAPSS
jgi:protocatechuate 4,5-dioxygenase, beta chain